MPSSGMLRRATPTRADVSEVRSASIIRVTRISELGTLAVTSNRRTVRINYMHISICSSDLVGSQRCIKWIQNCSLRSRFALKIIRFGLCPSSIVHYHTPSLKCFRLH
jgi:hypothetical protein